MGSLLNCSFDNTFSDSTERHTLENNTGVMISTERKVGISSAYFDGNSYLTYSGNRGDFTLGSTPIPMIQPTGITSLPDNNFTLECWVRTSVGGDRYYPICSSFNYYVGSLVDDIGAMYPYKCGWSLQIDSSTGTLQFIGYSFGNWQGSVLKSPSDKIRFNTWTHIAIQSWKIYGSNKSYKLIYINGQSTTPYPIILDECSWNNAYLDLGGATLAFFYVGVGPRSQFTDPGQSPSYDLNQDLNSSLNYRFKGWIDNLLISDAPEYDSLLFTPIGGDDPPLVIPPLQDSTIFISDGLSNTSEVSLIPVMELSSDNEISITGSGSYGSDNIIGAFRAFDRNLRTYWKVVGAGPGILLIDLGVGRKTSINKYRVYCTDSSLFPRSWSIQGSDDLISWQTLTSISDYTYSVSQFWTEWFYFSNATPYRYYRLSFGISQLIGEMRVGEITLVESEKYSSNPNASPSTYDGYVRVDPGGSAISSSQLFECEPSRAFDNNTDTYWSPMLPDNQWVGKKLGNYYNVTRYCVHVNEQQLFSSWELQGSNDGIHWNSIHTGSSVSAGYNSYLITNPYYYLYYRILFLTWVGTPGLCSLELWVTPSSILSSPYISSTASTTQSSTTTISTTTTTLTFTSSSNMTSLASTTFNPATTQPYLAYKNVTYLCLSTQASASHINHGSDNLISGNVSDYWSCSVSSGPPYQIDFILSSEVNVDEYVLYFDSVGVPIDWELQGSNDGTTWSTLHTISDNSITGRVACRFSNEISFLYYRLDITTPPDELDIIIKQVQFFKNSSSYDLESNMHYVGYQYTEPKIVKRYCMYVDESSFITEWKLQGSNDKVIWTDVDIRSEPQFTGWKCIEITNEVAFICWRVLILNWSQFSTPGLSELEFYEGI